MGWFNYQLTVRDPCYFTYIYHTNQPIHVGWNHQPEDPSCFFDQRRHELRILSKALRSGKAFVWPWSWRFRTDKPRCVKWVFVETNKKGYTPQQKANIDMENPPCWLYLPGKMGIFMGYLSFREGTSPTKMNVEPYIGDKLISPLMMEILIMGNYIKPLVHP